MNQPFLNWWFMTVVWTIAIRNKNRIFIQNPPENRSKWNDISVRKRVAVKWVIAVNLITPTSKEINVEIKRERIKSEKILIQIRYSKYEDRNACRSSWPFLCQVSTKSDYWIINWAFTEQISNIGDNALEFSERDVKIQVGNKDTKISEGYGAKHILSSVGGRTKLITLQNVLCAPDILFNII